MADRRSVDYDDRRDVAEPPLPNDPAGRSAAVLMPNEARQGTTRTGMRRVLTISLVGTVIVLAIAYFAFFPTPDGSQTALPPEPAPTEQPSP
jgi:hypothetical protein